MSCMIVRLPADPTRTAWFLWGQWWMRLAPHLVHEGEIGILAEPSVAVSDAAITTVFEVSQSHYLLALQAKQT